MSDVLLTRSQIEGWKARKREIPNEISRLEAEYGEIEDKLEAVRRIFGEELADAHPDIKQSNLVHSKERKPTWAFEIIRVLKAAGGPLSYDELRDEIDEGPLQGDFERSTKGFYNAVTRLQKNSEIKKHSDRLFLLSDYKKYIKGVEDGSVTPLEPIRTHIDRSPMGAEILSFVNQNPSGVLGKDVIEHLRSDKRFCEQLTKNTSGGYNVIARLVERNEIRRENSILYPFNENGEPAGSPEAESDEVSGLIGSLMSTQGRSRQ